MDLSLRMAGARGRKRGREQSPEQSLVPADMTADAQSNQSPEVPGGSGCRPCKATVVTANTLNWPARHRRPGGRAAGRFPAGAERQAWARCIAIWFCLEGMRTQR